MFGANQPEALLIPPLRRWWWIKP